jgi:transcriptional regulator with PAS, ATPase and Fis domain
MENATWLSDIDVAVTVCDLAGTVIYMNERAARTFASGGGRALLGKPLWACHPAAAQEKIRRIMASGEANTYTIEKDGGRKLVHQAPWRENGVLAGLVEFSLVIPAQMPHFVRN